jgi:hypothetical protein
VSSATFRDKQTQVQGFGGEISRRGDHWEDSVHSLEDDIKMYLKIWDERGGLNESGSGYREVVGCCEYSNEPLGYTKCRQFLE